jgi:hypothetical protein
MILVANIQLSALAGKSLLAGFAGYFYITKGINILSIGIGYYQTSTALGFPQE